MLEGIARHIDIDFLFDRHMVWKRHRIDGLRETKTFHARNLQSHKDIKAHLFDGAFCMVAEQSSTHDWVLEDRLNVLERDFRESNSCMVKKKRATECQSRLRFSESTSSGQRSATGKACNGSFGTACWHESARCTQDLQRRRSMLEEIVFDEQIVCSSGLICATNAHGSSRTQRSRSAQNQLDSWRTRDKQGAMVLFANTQRQWRRVTEARERGRKWGCWHPEALCWAIRVDTIKSVFFFSECFIRYSLTNSQILDKPPMEYSSSSRLFATVRTRLVRASQTMWSKRRFRLASNMRAAGDHPALHTERLDTFDKIARTRLFVPKYFAAFWGNDKG